MPGLSVHPDNDTRCKKNCALPPHFRGPISHELLFAAAAIVFFVVCLFVVYWGILVRRSLKDHVQLPYHHYK